MTSSSSTTTTTSKSVTFASSATMRLALHVNNYTDDEYDACWFGPEDYKVFKKDIIRTVRMIDNNNNDTAALLSSKRHNQRTLFCTRGVESRTREGMKIRYKNVQTAKLAVLGEQVRRRLQAENDDGDKEQTIATLYAKYSSSSVSAAYTKGLLDESVAKEQEQEEKTTHLGSDRPQTIRPHDITLQFMKQTVFGVQRNVRNSAA